MGKKPKVLESAQWGKTPLKYGTTENEEGRTVFTANSNPKDSRSDLEILQKLTATEDTEIAQEIMVNGAQALPYSEDNPAKNYNLAIQTLADQEPEDSVEARLCLQEHALYAKAMQCLGKVDGNSSSLQGEFNLKCAVKFLKLHNETIALLNKYRQGGEHKMIVQHVNVAEGGKAAVMAGGFPTRKGGRKENQEGLPLD